MNDLGSGMGCTLGQLVDDATLWGAVGTLKDRVVIWKDLDKMEGWINRDFIKFNKDEYKGVKGTLLQSGADCCVAAPSGKHWSLVVQEVTCDSEVRPLAMKASCIRGCTRESKTSRSRELTPLHLALTMLYMRHQV